MKLFKTREGRLIVSILWGLGLACLFRQVCRGRQCIIYEGPDPNAVSNQTFIQDNKCYRFYPKSTTCTSDALDISRKSI